MGNYNQTDQSGISVLRSDLTAMNEPTMKPINVSEVFEGLGALGSFRGTLECSLFGSMVVFCNQKVEVEVWILS